MAKYEYKIDAAAVLDIGLIGPIGKQAVFERIWSHWGLSPLAHFQICDISRPSWRIASRIWSARCWDGFLIP